MRFLVLTLLTLTAACHRPATTKSATTRSRLVKSATAKPTATTPPVEVADYSRYVRHGISFVAMGNEPSWSLTIQNDRQMTFGTPIDSAQVAMPTVKNGAKGEQIYQSENGKLRVSIRPIRFTDSMSGRVFDTTVEVGFRQDDGKVRTYKGGGTSLSQLLLLNDGWVLTSLNSEVIKPLPPRNAVPRLEFQVSTGRVTGTGGCNRLSGLVRADNQSITLGKLASTRMACPGDIDKLEARFLKELDGTLGYNIDNRVLTLSRAGRAVMVFKKVD